MTLFGTDLTQPPPDPRDERTRRWLLRIAAGHDPDRPASTPARTAPAAPYPYTAEPVGVCSCHACTCPGCAECEPEEDE